MSMSSIILVSMSYNPTNEEMYIVFDDRTFSTFLCLPKNVIF